MTRDLLNKIVSEKLELKNIPIIANIDFGHTTPASTLPIGGVIEVIAENSKPTIKIIEH
jgi:muramoyltetrapeptide carboxypeptidase LdcA involved in peptidoglycan recycling